MSWTEHFSNPGVEYRGCPLWCWNTKLEWPVLRAQIDDFASMGLGGFTIHVRVGLDVPYLGPEFMDLVSKSVAYAKEKGMQACLYDEDRWPSGSAGGLAVKGKEDYRAKHLLITPYRYGEHPSGIAHNASAKASRSENGRLIARVQLEQSPNDRDELAYRVLDPESSEPITEGSRWIYVESNRPSPWFNDETYADLLNPKAVDAFLSFTHDVYRKAVGSHFGSTVRYMFTDEPQFSHQSLLKGPLDKADLFLPWTEDLPTSYEHACGKALLPRLPEIIWDVPALDSARVRWQFHDHVCERFVSSAMDRMAKWCEDAGIGLTGHVMNEVTLLSQTIAVGEAMRCYRSMAIPGIDILCERLELNTAKQASSVARQNHGGPAWAMSEIYGVTNWTFTFASHKRVGDWQAALGINRRVHHLSPVTIAGEAKRDYPAAISHQSPWYKEYHLVEDHFARVNLALTTGKALTRVAVLHPIESMWVRLGPLARNGRVMQQLDRDFRELAEILLYNMIDFDYVAESLLPSQVGAIDQQMRVGEAAYDVIIVPALHTIRSSTVDILSTFAKSGGKVIWVGPLPTMVDASKTLFAPDWGSRIPFQTEPIVEALSDVRMLSACDHEGLDTTNLLHQLRIDGSELVLFVCNTDHIESVRSTLKVRGLWQVTVYDTITGSSWNLASSVEQGWTAFDWYFEGCGSLLCRLEPRQSDPLTSSAQVVHRDAYRFHGAVNLDRMVLLDDNVVLLDYAEYRLNDEPWQGPFEILRIDNIVRRRLSMPLKLEAAAQPWTINDAQREATGNLTLRLPFTCVTRLNTDLSLAIEATEEATLSLDGTPIPNHPDGWWVDRNIRRLPLCKSLAEGPHVLEISMPFGRLTNVERTYILGDFDVDVRGSASVVSTSRRDRLSWGDWTRQGLPFYAGNVAYHCSFEVDKSGEQEAVVQLVDLRGPVASVSLDGREPVIVALPPYTASLGKLSPGTHKLVITVFGNRENAFGSLHLAPNKTQWRGPNEWRTQFHEWRDEYDIKPMGLLGAAQIKVPGKDNYVLAFERRDQPLHTRMSNPLGKSILQPMQY